MIDILYIVGAVASILGAIIAWRQAANAKKYADKAKRQFIGHRRTSEFSRLEAKWTPVYEALAVFGPGAPPNGLRGRDTKDAGRKVQDYLGEVRRSSLNDKAEVRDCLLASDQLLDQFSRSSTVDDMKRNGEMLLNELRTLDSTVCGALRQEQEVVDLS